METLIFILELIGTVAFAASGAMTAVRKNMDVFGICILGLTTAVGGGVIRDLVLGITPPRTFQDPVYALVSIGASLLVFGAVRLGRFARLRAVYDHILLVMDTVGLGIFTVVGINVAYEQAAEPSAFLLIFVGTVTGVGGGVLRDVLAGNTPYIFVKHVYACASLLGAAACVLLHAAAGGTWAMLTGLAVVVLIRFLSAYFRWNLPKACHSVK